MTAVVQQALLHTATKPGRFLELSYLKIILIIFLAWEVSESNQEGSLEFSHFKITQ